MSESSIKAARELKPCPFCGRDGVKNFCCGAAIPNCPRCSDLFGCSHCDIWLDTADEWNTRKVADEQTANLRDRLLIKADAVLAAHAHAVKMALPSGDSHHVCKLCEALNKFYGELKEATKK